MEEIKNKIQQLVVQGESQLQNIPKKSNYKTSEKNIREKYRQNEPADSIGREVISRGAGELVSSLFGTGKGIGRSVASKTLRNQYRMQRDNEIRQLYQEYTIRHNEAEQRYRSWSSDAIQAIVQTKCQSCKKKFKESKEKVKLETRLKWGINSLNQTLNYLEQPIKKETLLIKSGEPLKGRKALKDFMEGVKGYVKIQEPYPTPEILETIEDALDGVKFIFLLGTFKNLKEKGKFEKNLALLRKVGKEIEVVSIGCPKTAPFHDRFLISKKRGITTGTSLSGLGIRDSVITGLNEWKDIEKRFDEYMIGPRTKHRRKECKRERL